MDEQFKVASHLETLESEPNKVAEYYREFHKANDQADFNTISDYKKHLPHFDCIQIYEGWLIISTAFNFTNATSTFSDGITMVCSSNLNGRLWKGSVIIYGSPDVAAEGDVSKSLSGTVTSAGIADGTFLSSSGDVKNLNNLPH
jgi:hypothetical protein